MSKILAKDIDANYDVDKKVINAANIETISISIDNSKKELVLKVDIDKDDHYLIFTFDTKEFMAKIVEALIENELSD